MLTQVSVLNNRQGTLLLPLMDSSDGYSVKEIDGLGPVKATLVSSSMAQVDGGELHNKRREPRNILMKLGIEADYAVNTVAELRNNLYDWFMTKSDVELGFYMDDVLFATIDATVESCDPAIFTSEPGVDISLLCYDPDFHAPDPVTVNGYTVSDTDTQTIAYAGTSDTGIVFTLTFPGSATEIRLYNTRPDNVQNMMDIEAAFQANDILTVDTRTRRKKITITRSGTVSSVLYGLDSASSWISLMKGDNLFRAYYNGAAIAFSLQYTPRHGGL